MSTFEIYSLSIKYESKDVHKGLVIIIQLAVATGRYFTPLNIPAIPANPAIALIITIFLNYLGTSITNTPNDLTNIKLHISIKKLLQYKVSNGCICEYLYKTFKRGFIAEYKTA